MKKLLIILLVCVLSLTTVFAQGGAEKGSTKLDDLSMYVTVKAGGALDVRARIVAEYLSKELGVGVTVVNVPGAGGLTCATQMLTNPSSPNDLMFSGVSTFTAGPVFEPSCVYTVDDFKVVSPMDVEEFGLFVTPSRSGFNNFDDVVKYGQNNELIFGCGGIANVTYLFQAALYEALGMKYNTLIHNGGIEGLTNAMGGHNMITMCGLETARPYVESGDVVPVLTFRDSDYTGYEGYTVPSVLNYVNNEENVYTSLMVVCGLASMDDAAYDQITAAMDKIKQDPNFIAEMEKVGLNYIPEMTNEEALEHIKAEYQTISDFVKQLNK